MASVVDDCDAWEVYPQHRWIFNKLELSLRLGYAAGPGGTSVPCDADYIIRPIYNLSGMGAGAVRQHLSCNDLSSVPPGYFWCELFAGANITVDYQWDNAGIIYPVFAAQGARTSPDLYRFSGWREIYPPTVALPTWITQLADVPRINVEFINNHIIEIHLRAGCDFPEGATKLIPVWSDMLESDLLPFLHKGYKFIDNADDADGNLTIKRVGFLYK